MKVENIIEELTVNPTDNQRRRVGDYHGLDKKANNTMKKFGSLK